MPQKKSAVAAALDTLYQQNPQVFKEFISAVSEDLGGPAGSKQAYEILCPHCSTAMVLSLHAASLGRRRRPSKGSIFGLILELAKLRGVMVGAINSEFTKKLGPKAKTITKEQYRSRKEKWLKQEIAKARR